MLFLAADGRVRAAPGVDPPSVSQSANPGDVIEVTKNVETPEIPPRPDIVFLADTTGSMGGAINNVKANAAAVMAAVLAAQPDAQFAVADYKDFNCDSNPFTLGQAITANTTDVQTAINAWSASGGCDFPEAQLNALSELATNPAVGFRTDSTRIIAWFGDAPGHDPSNGHTLLSTITALQTAGIRVIAINVGGGGLDIGGQATAIASATGGSFQNNPGSDDVAAAILAGLANLPAEVTHQVTTCDPSLTVSITPASQTVTSGDTATFTETITVALDAPQGSTITCTVEFYVNDQLIEGFTQEISIDVNDVTPPSAACRETTNPSGNNIPTSGPNAGKSGQNPDGFYELLARDNVGIASIVVADSGSSFVSGTFTTGDHVKITQTPGGTPSDTRPGPGGIASHLKLNGDAVLVVTDTSGNVTRVGCLVPPPPK